MGLVEDLRSLAERVRSDLDTSYEYYVNSRRAWRLVHQLVASGERFSILDRATETVADEKTVVALSRRYVAVDLASASLEKFVALLEDYMTSLHRLWLERYPGKLNAKQMSYGEMTALPDKPAIVRRFIDKELQDFAYKRPEMWFKDFNESAKLGRPTPDEVERICEIKATRDVLVHNRGIVNWNYSTRQRGERDTPMGKLPRYPTIISGRVGN